MTGWEARLKGPGFAYAGLECPALFGKDGPCPHYHASGLWGLWICSRVVGCVRMHGGEDNYVKPVRHSHSPIFPNQGAQAPSHPAALLFPTFPRALTPLPVQPVHLGVWSSMAICQRFTEYDLQQLQERRRRGLRTTLHLPAICAGSLSVGLFPRD